MGKVSTATLKGRGTASVCGVLLLMPLIAVGSERNIASLGTLLVALNTLTGGKYTNHVGETNADPVEHVIQVAASCISNERINKNGACTVEVEGGKCAMSATSGRALILCEWSRESRASAMSQISLVSNINALNLATWNKGEYDAAKEAKVFTWHAPTRVSVTCAASETGEMFKRDTNDKYWQWSTRAISCSWKYAQHQPSLPAGEVIDESEVRRPPPGGMGAPSESVP